MSKLRDLEIMNLVTEIHAEWARVYEEVKKTEKDHDEVQKKTIKILLEQKKHEEFRKKYSRWSNLMESFDRINIAEYVFSDSSLELYAEILENSRQAFREIDRDEAHGKDAITESIDLLFYNGRQIENVARNYYELIPPFVKQGVKIPKHVKQLYAESRWCYVLQNYCGTVALCRAVLELVLKDKLKLDKDFFIQSLTKYLDQAKEKKLIPEKAHWISQRIIISANKVLHAGKTVEKERALEVVEKTKDFLEKMY